MDFERYARQVVLPEIGEEGQQKLNQSSVLCIGAGGLGSPALIYLAAAGVGHIGIVDDDTVSISNLQRQILFSEQDIGRPKTAVAASKLSELNSKCHIEAYNERFTAHSAERLLASFDVVIDGTDNFASKFLINDACVKYNKTLIYGSILGFEAQVAVFSAANGVCYRCLYPKAPSGHIPNCAEAGVVGAMAGIAGTVQALEAVKMLLGVEWCQNKGLEPLLGKLWLLNARTMQTRLLAVPGRAACICHNDSGAIVLEESEGLVCSAGIKNISPANIADFAGRAVFIDVREEYELAAGMIEGALHIPLRLLLADKNAVSDLDRDEAVIVYCQHGVRSRAAAEYLLAAGFSDVSHIEGGFSQLC